jgi:hypothetical protein
MYKWTSLEENNNTLIMATATLMKLELNLVTTTYSSLKNAAGDHHFSGNSNRLKAQEGILCPTCMNFNPTIDTGVHVELQNI